MGLIDKLTAYLIRRNPERSLAAATYFLAHERIIRAARPGTPVEALRLAGDEYADHLNDEVQSALEGVNGERTPEDFLADADDDEGEDF